jgi:hypothetical protein
MKANGYININPLCCQYNKSWEKWYIRNSEQMSYIAHLDNIGAKDLVVKIVGGKPEHITGTYIHPRVLPKFMMWLSPKFTVVISDIVN